MIETQRKDLLKYTKDQNDALLKIEHFLNNSHEYDLNTFKLAGYAGTGKTTIIENIFTYARDILKLDVYIAAPTNAAVKNLRQKSENWLAKNIDYENKFRTLHSLLYGEPDEFGRWIPKCSFGRNQLVIIDESSMIDSMLEYDINKYMVSFGTLIIKVGDGFQLEPVGNDPKVLNNPNIEMKDVQRHNGSILDYVTKIREIKTSFIPNKSQKEVIVSPIKIIGDKWTDDIVNNINSIFIVGVNKTRVALNKYARINKFGENPSVIKETDQIIVIANSNLFKNSETLTVDGVLDTYPITLYTKDNHDLGECHYVKIKTENLIQEMFLFPNTLRSSVYHGEINIARDKFPQSLQHLILFRKYKKPLLKRNVLITTYGYAITAHKSQGSQWNNVYVHNDFWYDNPRWMYTAVSRAIKKLTVSSESSDEKVNWEIINGN